MRLLRVFWHGLKDVYGELFLIIGLSLLWWLAMVTIIAAAPATTALSLIGYRLASEQRVNMDFAKAAFKQHFKLSWRIGLVTLAGTIIIAANLNFYAQVGGILRAAVILFLYLALAWIAINLYMYPLVHALDRPSMWLALRNAALITFANPIYSLGLVLGLLILTAVSVMVPVLVVMLLPGLTAIIGARALLDRLEVAEQRGVVESANDN